MIFTFGDKRSTSHHLGRLVLNAVCHLDEIVRCQFTLEDLQDRLKLLCANIELVGDIFDTCTLEETRFVSGDHVLKALDILGVASLLSVLNLLMKFTNLGIRLLLVRLEVALGTAATPLAKNKKFKQVINDLDFCGGSSLACIRLSGGELVHIRLVDCMEGALLIATVLAATLRNELAFVIEVVALIIDLAAGAVREASVNIHDENIGHCAAPLRVFVL